MNYELFSEFNYASNTCPAYRKKQTNPKVGEVSVSVITLHVQFFSYNNIALSLTCFIGLLILHVICSQPRCIQG
jgi:hypothetical protein